MQCPVCRGQAENLTPNTMDGVVVGCAECGDYRIAGGAFHELMRLEAEGRVEALRAAKGATRSGWPMIGASLLSVR